LVVSSRATEAARGQAVHLKVFACPLDRLACFRPSDRAPSKRDCLRRCWAGTAADIGVCPLLGAPTSRRDLGEPRRGCWELVCRVARSGCIRWAAKWTQLTVARGCRQCGSAQRARSHASARRSPTRRQPAYSTIDVLLSTEVGMVQAPYGMTLVRASGVLSHPLASERGELPLLGPRRAALLHLRRAAHR